MIFFCLLDRKQKQTNKRKLFFFFFKFTRSNGKSISWSYTQGPEEEWTTVVIRALIKSESERVKYLLRSYTQKIKSDAASLENPPQGADVGMWQGYTDRRFRIALFMWRSTEQKKNHFCNIIGMRLMLRLRSYTNAGGKTQGPLCCVLSTSFHPPQPVISTMILKILLYMYEDGVVHPCVQ